MAIQQWKTGSQATFGAGYASAFGTEINSLTSGDSVLSSVIVDLSVSPCDQFGQISIDLGSVALGSAAPSLVFGWYPLNEDGTTYGDNTLSTTPSVGAFADEYTCGTIPLPASATTTLKGTTVIFPIPFVLVKAKLAVFNNGGVNLNASNNGIFLRTFNLQQV